jgi:preprotein translocase subunit SecF
MIPFDFALPAHQLSVSALLSIAAILLYFFHGLNFGIDCRRHSHGVQTKAGPADSPRCAAPSAA